MGPAQARTGRIVPPASTSWGTALRRRSVRVWSWHEALRPFACRVKDTKDFDVLASHAVGQDVGEARDDQFARTGNTTGAAHLWMSGQPVGCLHQMCDKVGGAFRTVLGDEVSLVGEVL